MPESWRTRLARWGFNWFPAYRGSGGRVTYIAADWREVRIRLLLGWRTRNYVGTIFGGSMYGAVDPVYMLMLIKTLGPGYVVWDKAATIQFRRPGRETLYATFRLQEEELAALRAEVDHAGRAEREFTVELVNAAGEVHATCRKLLSVRAPHKQAAVARTAPANPEERHMPDTRFHLAQVNIGRARGEMTDPLMADFVARLPEVNALADGSPGFVWRLQTEDGDATAVRPFDDARILINLSVWRDLSALRAYVYRSDHAAVMRRRREWFERFDRVYVALWWVPAGHRPSVVEAVARLAHLEQHGPTAFAFSFAAPFGPDDLPMPREGVTPDDACPAT